jgi:hypothetical protein
MSSLVVGWPKKSQLNGLDGHENGMRNPGKNQRGWKERSRHCQRNALSFDRMPYPMPIQEKFRKRLDILPEVCYTVGMELPPVPSELLEPHITKLMGILFGEYARTGCTKTGFKILLNQAKALSMLISSMRATHCNIAFTNKVQGMLWEMERDPEFMKTNNRHFKKVLRGS